ncbi:MAG: hypothetical protein NUW23_08065, partial [Firmicutes bacterium]|nr:hypothetical protein [Bacillota bacterium]
DELIKLTITSSRPDVGYSILPKGALIRVEFASPVSSVKSRPGDLVTIRVTEDVVSEGRLVVPKGSILTAKVTDTVRPSRLGVRAKVDMELGYLEGMDSAPVVLGVDQAAVGANTGITMATGDTLRRFSVLGKSNVLGQSDEVEIAPGTEFFLSVMQSAKILGLSVPAGR